MTGCFLRDMLPFMFAFILFSGLGGFLVFDSVSNSASLAEVLGGATLIALGLIALYPQGRLLSRWKNALRAEHHRNA